MRIPFGFVILFAILSVAGSAALTDRVSKEFMFTFLVLLTALQLAYVGLMRLAEHIGANAAGEPVCTLTSTDQAKRMAMAIIANDDEYERITAAVPLPNEYQFGPELQAFLDKYELVESHDERISIGRKYLGQPSYHKRLAKLGELSGGLQIAALPGDDRVFILNPQSEPEDPLESEPSVYHLFLDDAE